jgi:hypothetical protein
MFTLSSENRNHWRSSNIRYGGRTTPNIQWTRVDNHAYFNESGTIVSRQTKSNQYSVQNKTNTQSLNILNV